MMTDATTRQARLQFYGVDLIRFVSALLDVYFHVSFSVRQEGRA